MNGIVSSLGCEWSECKLRTGNVLKLPKLVGKIDSMKSVQRRAIKYEGVKLFNSNPEDIRTWSGSQEDFKTRLDDFLSTIPDQPETDKLIPSVRTEFGRPSNSIPDWVRVLNLNMWIPT